MLPAITLFFFGVVATLGIASQTPGTVKNETANTSNDHCDPTTVGVVGGGQIQVSDCFAIMNIPHTANFSVEMSNWKDSTEFTDQYHGLFAVGSCELAVKRMDSGKSTTWIGKFDIRSIINQSVQLARTGDGDQMETTHGKMDCNSEHGPAACISWTVREAGNETRADCV
ncbi:hypothetical protein KVR01_005768 [Diaporthe batatas]|uniref:uncharacterized protein n=1 Tax=Diaporthe batatas TaxID=748121 RepID=UPI001D04F145|nr:uncharacterized protein KVR01_005768 [Diaporthe batatas]KAG8163850.1 hypothetical protein KVR01_005768 [Diaporthe batatas]